MTGYTFTLTCPHCGERMEHKASGAVYASGTCALAACTDCGAEYRIDLRVQRLNAPRLNRPEPMGSLGMQPTTETGRRLVAAFEGA